MIFMSLKEIRVAGLGVGKCFDIHLVETDELDNLSSHQFAQIEEGTCYDVEDFDDNKVLSEARLEKYNKMNVKSLLRANGITQENDSLQGLRLGVLRFIKYRASYTPHKKLNSLDTKGLVHKYVVYSQSSISIEKTVNTFTTFTDAKTFAQNLLIEHGYWSTITQHNFKDGHLIADICVGSMRFEKVGDMKSRPKNKPKSYIVLPDYLYAYCLAYDYEEDLD